jgi:hypothetical protein
MITLNSSSQPLASDPSWTSSAPTSYPVSGPGIYTLYPWAKDASGNVSVVYTTPLTVVVDTQAPAVISFTAKNLSTVTAIPITAFTATDDVAVAGYLITTTSTPPAANDSGWTTSAPLTYTVAGVGSYLLYPWVKDTAGNVSGVFASPAGVSVGPRAERLKNGGFENYASGSLIASSWPAINFRAHDGKDTTTKKQGTASMKITGTGGLNKSIKQTIMLRGGAGDLFTFSYWAKGLAIPKGSGTCKAQVTLFNGLTQVFVKTWDCVTGTTVFKKTTYNFTNPTSPYDRAVIKFIYTKPYGTIWLDAVSLVR